MALVRYDPFRHLNNIRRDFDSFFSNLSDNQGFEQSVDSMKVDLKKTENEVIATCDLPGLEKKEDIDLKVEPGTLHISGTINRSTEEKQENVHRRALCWSFPPHSSTSFTSI